MTLLSQSHNLHFDASNIYGWEKSHPLSTGGFAWNPACTENIADHTEGSPEGYILDVNLEYAEDLHNAHNAYPLAPEHMVKLVPNLHNKKSYVLPYRNLQLYLYL